MEDEECIPENSPLKLYLQDLGYTDFSVSKNEKPELSCLYYECTKPKSRWDHVEYLGEEVIEQIGVLISTQMLFEEDITNIEKLLSNFKVVKNGMFKSMFQGVFGVAIVFLGLCFYLVIGSYAFFLISSFYAYRAATYLKKRHFVLIRIKKLASCLESNFTLLRKTLNFVKENSKILELHESNSQAVTFEFKNGFDHFHLFKSEFSLSLKEIIDILTDSTQKLIKKFPLCEYMENPQCYVCQNINTGDYESIDMFKLYQLYLLVQSEFLQRLILSLIPNIKLSAENSGFNDLNKILTETCIKLLKVKNKLHKKFKFVFLNGLHIRSSKVNFKLPAKNKVSHNDYSEEFVSNIHDTSNAFQNLLIKSRILEENLISEKIPDTIEEELVNIQNDLNTCQKNIADSFILLKKANSTPEKQSKVAVKVEKEECNETIDKVVLGYSTLDPKVEDDIFEAYFTGEKLDKNLCDSDEWDFEDRLKKKSEKEFSEKVIKELKIKLVEKAKVRQKKEIELLRKKGLLIDENINENLDVNKNEFDDLQAQNSHLETIANEILPEHHAVDYTPVNTKSTGCLQPIQANDAMTKDKFENGNVAEDELSLGFGGFNKQFLDDISQARQMILKTSNVEEFYYDSSDEESVEN